MAKPYTEISISKETRETLSISSKDALLHHLTDIKKGFRDLELYIKHIDDSGYDQLESKLNSLIRNIRKYS